ncbi:MAG: cytochrome c oxidase accessory protein CcoG [Phycisphaeraceae bacterium]|nr:cytochrome c oxidase accessory protein CcoG [Phycisphaeraceae bacterium]MBX3406195.1 cytochrome c oxidase accessory protein CcoG [Phycisphaeraceae bacterium]
MNATIPTPPSPHTSPAPTGASPEGTGILSTLNDDGTRRWLMPRVSPGRFLTARRAVAYLLIAIFTLIPYIEIGGKPLVLLDIASRRFTLFGKTFLPTDTLLMALLMVGVFLAIFFFTALFGRVWCGWACPQTVYMEFLYRPIERLFEGSPGRVRSGGFRGSAPAKGLKYVAFVACSAFLAHTFLAYFVGVEQLRHWIFGSPLNHPIGFGVVVVVTLLMLADFGFFREQICLVACPYGRMQAALLDRNSLIISYDRARGEPRGKGRREPRATAPVALTIGATDAAAATMPPALGDCIDCRMCVTTCPTGIDIRNGLQMECIGCAQCIDACDAVMDKIGLPRGLVRYSSQSAMSGAARRILRPRVVVYFAVLTVVATAFTLLLSTMGGMDLTVLRGLGQPYTLLEGGRVSNPVKLRIVNRSDMTRQIGVEVVSPASASMHIDPAVLTIAPGESATAVGSLYASDEDFADGRCVVTLRTVAEGGQSREARFIMTGPRRKGERP